MSKYKTDPCKTKPLISSIVDYPSSGKDFGRSDEDPCHRCLLRVLQGLVDYACHIVFCQSAVCSFCCVARRKAGTKGKKQRKSQNRRGTVKEGKRKGSWNKTKGKGREKRWHRKKKRERVEFLLLLLCFLVVVCFLFVCCCFVFVFLNLRDRDRVKAIK